MTTESRQEIYLRFPSEAAMQQAIAAVGGDPALPDQQLSWGCALSTIGIIQEPTGSTTTDPETGAPIAITAPVVNPATGQPWWHVNAMLPQPISRDITDPENPGPWIPYDGMPASIVALFPLLTPGTVRPNTPVRVWFGVE